MVEAPCHGGGAIFNSRVLVGVSCLSLFFACAHQTAEENPDPQMPDGNSVASDGSLHSDDLAATPADVRVPRNIARVPRDMMTADMRLVYLWSPCPVGLSFSIGPSVRLNEGRL
jgi:hypothetical protein